MSYVDLSQSFDWLNVMNSLPSLLELHLSYCTLPSLNPTRLPNLNSSSLLVLDLSRNSFGGPIPDWLQNMTSSLLWEFDLPVNHFNSSIPNWLCDSTHLQLLNLGNQLQGQISNDVGNLTSLITLHMSKNEDLEFEKGIPKSFRNLCNLRSLDLLGVKLNQEIHNVLAVMSRCVSNVLERLVLQECQLSGHLTDVLGYFKNLAFIDASDNSISVQFLYLWKK
ncbi:hypothetical protein M5689_020075 [Euphorbia peplus]|nr:hypothetical protein M5689_020075 [Euphorbia peplus]